MDRSINNDTGVDSDQKLLKKINLTISLIILFAGLICVGLSAFNTYEFFRKSKNYVETVATVSSYEINNKGLRAVIITYEVDGEKYDLYTKDFKQKIEEMGKIVSVKYDPDNPSDAIRSNATLDVVFPAISLVIFIVGFIKTIHALRSKKKKPVEEKVKEEVVETTEQPKVINNGNLDFHTIGELRMPSNEKDESKEN